MKIDGSTSVLLSRKIWTLNSGVNKLYCGEDDMHFLRSLNQLNEYYLRNRGHTTGKHKLSLTKVCHPVTFYLLGSKKSENICNHKNNNHALPCSIYTLNMTCIKYCKYPKICY